MAKEKRLKGPYWTRNWIEAMWRFTNENFVDFDSGAVDYEALGREEFQFRKALFFRNFKNSERAKLAFDTADEDYKRPVENGKKGGRPKKSPQDAPNGNAGDEVSDTRNGAASKSPTSCDIYEQAGNPLTRESEPRGPQTDNNSEAVKALADGDIREDSHDGKSGTSANIYGDAATRKGAEAVHDRESGVPEPTTVSKNMRRVPQNEAPAHGFSGGRTAQGTMSRSPEAAAQSGKAYDQETAKTRDTRDDSRGRYAPPSCSPEDGNPAETAPSHGGSVASLEARQGLALESRRAGAAPLDHAPARNLPRNKEEVRLFAIDNGLDVDDANDWAEMNLRERHGRDKDGKPIRNWKGAIRNYCKAMAAKRETA